MKIASQKVLNRAPKAQKKSKICKKSTPKKNPLKKQKRNFAGANATPPASQYRFDPVVDFPLNQKLLIVENVPLSEDETTTDEQQQTDSAIAPEEGNDKNTEKPLTPKMRRYNQMSTLHGVDGAVTLQFDALAYGTTKNDDKLFNYKHLQSTDPSQTGLRPLRLAMASTGLSKDLISDLQVFGAHYLVWNRNELTNFTVKGEDLNFLTGEDALISGHIGADSDSRYEYIPVNTQNAMIIKELMESLQVEEQIERLRLQKTGGKLYKDIPKQGMELLDDLNNPLGGRKALNVITINDTDEERVKFRDEYLAQHPEFATKYLTDEQKRVKRQQLNLHQPAKDFFLHKSLPLPVVTPLHSFTEAQNIKQQKLQRSDEELLNDDNNNDDYSTLTASEVFDNRGKQLPITTAAILGVADGVGGMNSYGKANETKEMSHQLMRLVRHSLTTETNTARDLLGQAYLSFLANNNVSLGACTSSIGLIKSADPDIPEDEFDDGRRLNLSIANAGDSTLLAFRPKHNQAYGTTKYTPLFMAWPLHHRWNTENPPPFQFTVYDYTNKPPSNPRQTDTWTTLSTSHYATPTPEHFKEQQQELDNKIEEQTTTATDEKEKKSQDLFNEYYKNKKHIFNTINGPSGGYQVFISPHDYKNVIAGRVLPSTFLNRKQPNIPKVQQDAFNNSLEVDGDQPWMAQGMDGVKLRRGDVVVAFSDGIADNLSTHIFTNTASELWEAVVGYLHPAVRCQHPATRNVRPFRQALQQRNNHLGTAILTTNDGLQSVETILKVTEDELAKLPNAEQQIKPFNPEEINPAQLTTALLLPRQPPPQKDENDQPLSAEQQKQFLQEQTEKLLITDPKQQELAYKYQQLQTQGIRFQSTLDHETEAVIAGTLATAYAGGLVRFSQRAHKIDDMSVVCGIVY